MSQTGDLQVDEMMHYELSLYPMSLFEANNILCQLDKPQLAEAIKNYASPKSHTAVTQTVPGTEHYVVDGELRFYRLKWMEGCTYSSNTDDYGSFTVKHYAKTTVVLMVMGMGQT